MVALQIRDVPEDVRDALAARARARGQSLQAFLLSLVVDEARRARNAALLERFEGRTDGVDDRTTRVVTEALDQARGSRQRIETDTRTDGVA